MPLQALKLKVGTKIYSLQKHTPKTLTTARRTNLALALIPTTQDHRITHYAEVAHEDLATHRPTRITVSIPNKNPKQLPDVVHMAFHIPSLHKEKHYAQKFATATLNVHPKLSLYNAKAVPTETATYTWQHADDFHSPLDTAKSLLFMHPELGSRDPYTATIVMEDHIASPDNMDNLNALAKVISKQGKSGWAKSANSVDKNGETLKYGYDFGPHKEGDPVLTYTLSEKTLQALTAPLQKALQTSKNDIRLQNKTWSVNQGTTVVQTQNSAIPVPHNLLLSKATPGLNATSAGNKVKWKLQDKTGHHGLSVFDDSIQYRTHLRSIQMPIF